MGKNKAKEIFQVIIDSVLFILFFALQAFFLIMFAILMEIFAGRKILPW